MPTVDECMEAINDYDEYVLRVIRGNYETCQGIIRRLFSQPNFQPRALSFQQLMYIRKLCQYAGSSLDLEIAYDINISGISFQAAKCSSSSQHIIFDDIATQAKTQIAKYKSKTASIRYAGIDLENSTLITTENIRMNAIQYAVYNLWLVEGKSLMDLTKEFPAEVVLIAAASLQITEESPSDYVPLFDKIKRIMTFMELCVTFHLQRLRLETDTKLLYAYIKHRRSITLAGAKAYTKQMRDRHEIINTDDDIINMLLKSTNVVGDGDLLHIIY